MKYNNLIRLLIGLCLISGFAFAVINYNGEDYTESMMPLSQTGTGTFRYVVMGSDLLVTAANRGKFTSFEINGKSYVSSVSAPVDVALDNMYFIEYIGSNRNASFSLTGVNNWVVLSSTSLTGFIAEPETSSLEQSFTVSAQNLTANISLSAPTNYEISTSSGSGFGPSLTLTQSGGNVASTTIYVRLKSGLSEGSYNGEDITITTTGMADNTVTCSGDVRVSITPSTTSLTDFFYVTDTGPSSEQSFTVSGQDLTANISVSAPTNYEISTSSGSGFGPSLTLTQSSGSVSSTTIYVRLKSGLSEGSYNGENITISSTGKTSKTVSCSGSVGPLVLNVKVFVEGAL